MNGIYKITNLPTGRFYIGSAVDVDRRWKRHASDLNAQRHHNSKLQRAWNKYGQAAFTFELLEEVGDLAILLEREQHYMDTLKPFYNINPKAGSALGYKHTDEAKRKNSEIAKRVWANMTPEERARKGQEHSEKLKGHIQSPETRKRRSDAIKRSHTAEIGEAKAKARAKHYLITLPTGEEQLIYNMSKFCREHGLVKNSMLHVVKTGKLYRGYGAREA